MGHSPSVERVGLALRGLQWGLGGRHRQILGLPGLQRGVSREKPKMKKQKQPKNAKRGNKYKSEVGCGCQGLLVSRMGRRHALRIYL